MNRLAAGARSAAKIPTAYTSHATTSQRRGQPARRSRHTAILPIYFTEHGISLPMLGVVVAAWSVARLIGEPLFGRIADNAPRRTMMVIGLFGAAVFAVAPLFVAGPIAFVATRLLAGLSASIYDPAARGYLVDANPPERQGETFGLYGAAQMGGLI